MEFHQDMASTGFDTQNTPTDWWPGPKWLQGQNSWRPNMATGPSNETESEAKVIKEVVSVAFREDDQQDNVTIWVVAPSDNSPP